MFRHKNKPKKDEISGEDKSKDNKKEKIVSKKVVESDSGVSTSNDSVKNLLEKNLKWSQIIYEQNRKINHKLMWAAIAGWLRLLLILAPLIIALFYLPPIIKSVWSNFNNITGYSQGAGDSKNGNSLENLLKVFNLNTQQKEQLKTILK